MTIGLGPRGTGKLRLVRPGVLLHWCPGCGAGHSIDVHELNMDGRRIGWDGSFTEPSIAEPVRHETDRGTCEYLLRAGVLYFMNNCWHEMRGTSRTLEEFPL